MAEKISPPEPQNLSNELQLFLSNILKNLTETLDRMAAGSIRGNSQFMSSKGREELVTQIMEPKASSKTSSAS